jgi:hypothetical protein
MLSRIYLFAECFQGKPFVKALERANPAISGFPKPLPTRWSKRVLTRKPQVSESNDTEMSVRAGQPGIPSEAVSYGGNL